MGEKEAFGYGPADRAISNCLNLCMRGTFSENIKLQADRGH